MSFDSREFRNALGWFATGVAVVTTNTEQGDAIGITVNSFSSVSLEPPLVLWCLDKSSDTLETFSTCSSFTISILNASQEGTSNQLATPGQHQLEGLVATDGVNGCKGLADALARFECEVETRHDAGDHIIFIGRVVDFFSAEQGAPLIYHRGGYQALAT